MKKVFYIVEERRTKDYQYLGDVSFDTLEEAKRDLENKKDYSKHSRCFKGQTLSLIKQTYLIDDEDENDVELLEEDYIEEVEF